MRFKVVEALIPITTGLDEVQDVGPGEAQLVLAKLREVHGAQKENFFRFYHVTEAIEGAGDPNRGGWGVMAGVVAPPAGIRRIPNLMVLPISGDGGLDSSHHPSDLGHWRPPPSLGLRRPP
ncbi:hypothetical protein CRG98_018441 [Punica granatum]|uniref:Uncharacterized protein n=1 Tax=Punica granatum TaxID=22663 RepID=A0A2I0JXV0_PUNGR|nr:hypothetical protein CRG98_018441 [Punica granatum]